MVKVPGEMIEDLVQQKLDGRSYSLIRSELAESGLTGDEISKVIREVDEKVLKAETGQRFAAKTRQWYRTGLFLAIAGLILSIAYNAGIILNDFPPIAVYSPFLAGVAVMFYGRMLQRQHKEPAAKGPGRIRKQRPYK